MKTVPADALLYISEPPLHYVARVSATAGYTIELVLVDGEVGLRARIVRSPSSTPDSGRW